MRRRLGVWVVVVPAVVVALGACGRTPDDFDSIPLLDVDGGKSVGQGDPKPEGGASDAAKDAVADALPDGGADAEPDAEPMMDAGVDAEPMVDAGPDATPVDSGPDATPFDSGPDATPVDSGPDATPMDSGPDAMPVDSGPDATPVDSGPDAEPEDAGPDVEVDAEPDAEPVDAGPDVVADAPVDAPKDQQQFDVDIFDVLPIPDSGPIFECATCVKDACYVQVNTCVNDPKCAQGLVCAVQKCVGGGGPNVQCLLGCFNGNVGALLEAVQAFQCIGTKCGADCIGAIGGGFPGGGGVPGGGGAPAPAPPVTPESGFAGPTWIDPTAIVIPPAAAFDAWPGLVPVCGGDEKAVCD